ncbi:MAG: hypothetical protein U0353_35015 [Sandaracinus sp.]
MEHALGVALEGVEIGGLDDRTLGWADRLELQLQLLEDEVTGAARLLPSSARRARPPWLWAPEAR